MLPCLEAGSSLSFSCEGWDVLKSAPRAAAGSLAGLWANGDDLGRTWRLLLVAAQHVVQQGVVAAHYAARALLGAVLHPPAHRQPQPTHHRLHRLLQAQTLFDHVLLRLSLLTSDNCIWSVSSLCCCLFESINSEFCLSLLCKTSTCNFIWQPTKMPGK